MEVQAADLGRRGADLLNAPELLPQSAARKDRIRAITYHKVL